MKLQLPHLCHCQCQRQPVAGQMQWQQFDFSHCPGHCLTETHFHLAHNCCPYHCHLPQTIPHQRRVKTASANLKRFCAPAISTYFTDSYGLSMPAAVASWGHFA